MTCRRLAKFFFCGATLIFMIASVRGIHASGTDGRASTTESTQLITMQPGDLPIILSAPHGGRLPIPNATTRESRHSATTKFTVVMDRNVDKLTLRVADEIQKRTGKRPYIVVANFSRKFVDANRDPADAYDSDAGRAVYEQYHAALADARKEILRRFDHGFLIDIHGHGGDPNTIVRGSANWASVKHLTATFGKDAIVGEHGLLGPLAAAGYTLVPANADADALEVKSLDGGFITRRYGSANFTGDATAENFDAIQLELGLSQRTADGIDHFAPVLADSIIQFTDRFMLPTTRPTTNP